MYLPWGVALVNRPRITPGKTHKKRCVIPGEIRFAKGDKRNVMKQNQYYDLIASLPHLKDFARAERSPISRERLRERMSMLVREDRQTLEHIVAFIQWSRHPLERSDEEMISEYNHLKSSITDDRIMEVVDTRINVRTIVAALRRRARGLPAPRKGTKWGMGKWVRHIEEHWEDPDFKLRDVFPWISQAREFLTASEPVQLEKLLMSVNWNRLVVLTGASNFEFEVVLSYLFKWDILTRWVSYDGDEARMRFEELMTEVMHGTEELFAEED